MQTPRASSRAFGLGLSLALAVAAAVAGALPAIAKPGGPRELLLPGPAPRPGADAIDGIGAPTDERCARCHEEIAEEWRGSLHRRSWQNEYFLRSYAMEPLAFCRKCHAPGADPSREPPPEAREAGVGCTTCHVVPEGVVGVRAHPAREGAHEVLGDARLATTAACGGCHQFALPGPPGASAGPMQDTLGEHQRSAESATTCQECHMPRVPSRAAPGSSIAATSGGQPRTHRSHDFRVQDDRSMLARAVVVKSAALLPGEVRLSLEPGAIGHAFPTGDLHRQVEVRAAPIDESGRAIAAGGSVILGRTFGPSRDRSSDSLARVELEDTRLVGPRTVALPVPKTTRRARFQIVWQRLPPKLAARLGMKMADHEMVVVEGVVTR